MKAPQFWFEPTNWQAKSLLPLAALFWLGGFLRRLLTRAYRAKIPVICIGNIIAGGAGKTPTCIAIANFLLQQEANPVFVTRGYGGSVCGPLRVDPTIHIASQVGDEALLLARIAPTWISRNRAAGIKAAEAEATHIIMDDGLQNPTVKPSMAFLVMDGAVGIGNGLIIPAGPLRETLHSAEKRIDGIILIGSSDVQGIGTKTYSPVMHARILPDLSDDFPKDAKFFAFAGIGRPEKFYQTCSDAELNLVGTTDFPDHHTFTENELLQLEQKAQAAEAKLLTTEKDWVRLPPTWQTKIATLPIKLVFDIPELPRSFLKG